MTDTTKNDAQGVGGIAARGAMFGLAATLVSKLLSFVSQLVLAWCLIPEEMGLAAIALSLTGMAQMMQIGSGLYVVLLSEKVSLLKTGSQAFYLGLITSSCLSCLMLLLSPIAGEYYGNYRITQLIVIQALVLPLDSFGMVETAWLARQLHFGKMNLAGILQSIARYGSQITLALCGFGVFSLVVPNVVGALTKIVTIRALAPRFLLQPPTPALWVGLWRQAFWITLNGFFTGFSQFGILVVLGCFLPNEQIGLYFWAFALAGQTAYLISGSLNNVFLPVFSRIGSDPGRQRTAFLRSSLAITLLLAPSCVLVSLLASDIVRLVFADRWFGAWPAVAVLSLGFVCQPLLGSAQALMMAQNRFRAVVACNAFTLMLSTAAGFAGWWTHSLVVIAIAHSTAIAVGISAMAGCACYPELSKWKSLVYILSFPFMLSCGPALLAWCVGREINDVFLRITCITVLFLLSYFALIKLLIPSIFNETIGRISDILGQMFHRSRKFLIRSN